MSKSLKQEQDELFAGLEDILPTKKELATEKGIITRTQRYQEDKSVQQRKANGSKAQAEKMKEKFADPEFKKKFVESRKKLYADPEFRRKQTEGNRKSAQDPVARKNRLEANRKKVQNPEWIKGHKERSKKLSQNKEFCAAAGERNKKRCMKPIVTPEGIFAGLNMAAKRYNEIKNQSSTQNWLMKQIKIDPSNFYYISKEEYVMLTGKEI